MLIHVITLINIKFDVLHLLQPETAGAVFEGTESSGGEGVPFRSPAATHDPRVFFDVGGSIRLLVTASSFLLFFHQLDLYRELRL